MPDFKKLNEETLDIKGLILSYTQYWYYFLISLIFFISIAFLYIRFTIPEYSVYTTLKISNNEKSIIDELDVFEKSNLTNEIITLKSYTITEKIVKELDIGISYFQHGILQTNELYETCPFVLRIDSSHNQLIGVDYAINIINENKFNLKVKAENVFPYDVLNDKNDKNYIINIDIDKDFSFGEKISEENLYSFKISKNTFFNKNHINKKYSLKINTTNKIAQKIRNKITINPVTKDSDILKLSIKDKNPKKNIAILKKMTEIYVRTALEEKRSIATNTLHFLDEELKIVNDSLKLLQDYLTNFKLQNKEFYENLDNSQGTYYQKVKLDNTVSEQTVKIINYQALLSYLKDNNNTIFSPTSMGITNPELNILIEQLHLLYDKERELKLTTTEKNPAYKSIVNQIEYTKKTIIENVTNLISSAKLTNKELKNRINSFDNSLKNFTSAEKEYIVLKRRYDYHVATEKYLTEKRYDAAIVDVGATPGIRVIDPAMLESNVPIKPRKMLIYFFAFCTSIFFPISIISLRNFFNDTIRRKKDIVKFTNTPIIGVIGHSDSGTNIITANAPKSIIAESFRSIRTNIQHFEKNENNKIISISSSIGSEGKTFVAMNLAAIFAAAEYKTLLIGGDLRKPKLHTNFKIDRNKGLSSYLLGKHKISEIIQNSHIENLNIITSGPIPSKPAELIESSKMNDIICKLKTKYDYIIIDTPPIGLVTDALLLMQHCDINLYVVRHNFSKIKTLNIVNNLENNKKVKNLRILINDNQVNKMGSYGYAYGYEYGYYGYYEEDN
tara:strand:- start:82501 stop:84861 length:2361 start_codon:yes stop_codon:yes gene_type:complete